MQFSSSTFQNMVFFFIKASVNKTKVFPHDQTFFLFMHYLLFKAKIYILVLCI